MDPRFFLLTQVQRDEDDQFQAHSNYQHIINGLHQFFRTHHGSDETGISVVFEDLEKLRVKLETMASDIEENSIRSINQAAFVNLETLLVVMKMALCLAVNCDNTEQIIGNFTEKLDEQTLDFLMQIT
mmetsp:Transcript_41498/g.63346  ORF Transcript_41498/g.63346 Transcript_41498/m.63346 type:complete len:128 (-) Transcript_41498:822-1205(-)